MHSHFIMFILIYTTKNAQIEMKFTIASLRRLHLVVQTAFQNFTE